MYFHQSVVCLKYLTYSYSLPVTLKLNNTGVGVGYNHDLNFNTVFLKDASREELSTCTFQIRAFYHGKDHFVRPRAQRVRDADFCYRDIYFTKYMYNCFVLLPLTSSLMSIWLIRVNIKHVYFAFF